MAGENAVKVTLYFPLRDNDDVEFPVEVWEWWQNEMHQMLKGFTDRGVVHGWWLEHSDENRWISVIVKSQEEVDQIREFLKKAKAEDKFNQDAMYLEYHPTRFEEVS